MASPPPPSPIHLLRSHTSSITALYISLDNERLYSADSSGRVVITNTRSLRTSASWQAHNSSVLGVQEWESGIITHGRDNKLIVWTRVDVGMEGYESMESHGAAGGANCAVIAVPNLIDSALVDIWRLPSKDRIHAAIGKVDPGTRERGTNATGILMALHLFEATENARESSSSSLSHLHVLAAYEDGSVALRRYAPSQPTKTTSVEGIGWSTLWRTKLHVESVMAMAVSKDNNFALTVSADHLIGRYNLSTGQTNVHRTKYPGNACVSIRDDIRVCAIGGWDGRVRIYASRALKALGTLVHHKASCQALVFAHSSGNGNGADEEDEEEDGMTVEEKQARSRWLVAGGKEGRISIWSLMDFQRERRQ